MDDLWGNIGQALSSIANGLTSIVIPVAVVALIICGIMMFLGEESARTAKSWMKKIGIGLLIALAASSIINWVATIVTF